MSYMDKINDHVGLDLDDIKDFIFDQTERMDLSDYVRDVKIDNGNKAFRVSCAPAGYDFTSKCIFINPILTPNFSASAYKKYAKKDSEHIENFYNLYIMNTIFHELWHAEQQKLMSEQSGSDYARFIASAYKLVSLDYLYYALFYHDRYYHEYDAHIHSMLLTTEFMKQFSFDEDSISVMNRLFADDILRGYGFDKCGGWDFNFRKPPMHYIIDLMKILGYRDENSDEYERLCILINKYISSDKSETFDGLLIGDRIPLDTRAMLHDIRTGSKTSIDLVKDIKDSMEESEKRYTRS